MARTLTPEEKATRAAQRAANPKTKTTRAAKRGKHTLPQITDVRAFAASAAPDEVAEYARQIAGIQAALRDAAKSALAAAQATVDALDATADALKE